MSSCVCLLTERFLNKLPITGMLPKPGTCRTLTCSLSGEVRRRVLDVYLENNGALVRDLRRHRQLQREIEKLHRNRVVDGCLNRDLDPLLDKTFNVVLRDDFRLRDQLG